MGIDSLLLVLLGFHFDDFRDGLFIFVVTFSPSAIYYCGAKLIPFKPLSQNIFIFLIFLYILIDLICTLWILFQLPLGQGAIAAGFFMIFRVIFAAGALSIALIIHNFLKARQK